MGPLATADLFRKIIARTQAGCDQEHLHVLIDSNTDIPDRTRAILHGGDDPTPQLIKSAVTLQAAGADFLIMPCNTAHFFHARVQAAVKIPVLNMLDETAVYLKKQGIHKVGLLATDGTIQAGVYEGPLKKQGVEALVPDENGQKEVMRTIYEGIKAGNCQLDTRGFVAACQNLLDQGAQTLVLGCTELPPAFSIFQIDMPNTDPTMVLAEAAIRFAGGELAQSI